MEVKKQLELIKDYLIVKTWVNSVIYKALPVGTKRQRKDGIYQKQQSGEWKKIKEGKGINQKEVPKNNIIKLKTDENGNYIAPNGAVSLLNKDQFRQTRGDNFKKWFGDFENNPKEASKILDSNGDPQIIYHGTNEDFEEYDFSKKGSGGFSKLTGDYFKPEENEIYLTSSESHASQYGDAVKPLYVNIRNPEIINSYDELDSWRKDQFPQYETVQEMIDDYYDGSVYNAYDADRKFRATINGAKKEGKDGCIFDFKNLKDTTAKKMGKVIIAFNPNQIKSATKNTGSFGEGNNINKNDEIDKALPVGIKRQRKSGTYQKMQDGSWKRVKDRSTEKNPYQNLPKDLKTMQPKQEKAILNSMKKDFSTHELKQRSNKISNMIKKQEKALNKRLQQMKKRGVDISKVKTPVIDNLKKIKAMHDKVIQDNINPQQSKPAAIKKPMQAKPKEQKAPAQNRPKQFQIDPIKAKQIKLPAKFKQYGKNIDNMPKKIQEEYKQWVKDNWSKG